MISNSYKSALESIQSNDENVIFNIIGVVRNCDDALEIILKSSNNRGIDIVFLDIQLPSSKNRKILSGEDLGFKIKEFLPKSKIIVSTMFNDNYRIINIFRSLNPAGFLIKNDLSPDVLVAAIEKILISPPYYSNSVLAAIRKQIANRDMIDEIDRKLLYELSLGAKMKDLPKLIPLSMAGLEKRKRHLKEIFDVNNLDDRALIIIAKEKGFI